MKVIKRVADSFFFQGKYKTAILLIHGFTGSPAELRLLGEYLNNHGYTVYAPLLAGHGTTPEEMAKTNKENWWNSVVEAYDLLLSKGYSDIIAVGLSMGGTLSLKLAMNKPLSAVVSMAAPIYVHNRFIELSRWIKYLKAFQAKKRKAESIEQYLVSYDRTPIICAESLDRLIKEVRVDLGKVTVPILIMQGKNDETVRFESAEYIYDKVNSVNKKLKWYDNSTHILTLDQERDKVFFDVLEFLKGFSQGEIGK